MLQAIGGSIHKSTLSASMSYRVALVQQRNGLHAHLSKGFLGTADGAQVAKRSESPPKEAAPKEGALTWPASAGGFFETALGSHFASRFNLKPSENAGAKTDGPRMAASQEASEEGSSQPDQPDVTFDSILVSAVR